MHNGLFCRNFRTKQVSFRFKLKEEKLLRKELNSKPSELQSPTRSFSIAKSHSARRPRDFCESSLGPDQRMRGCENFRPVLKSTDRVLVVPLSWLPPPSSRHSCRIVDRKPRVTSINKDLEFFPPRTLERGRPISARLVEKYGLVTRVDRSISMREREKGQEIFFFSEFDNSGELFTRSSVEMLCLDEQARSSFFKVR